MRTLLSLSPDNRSSLVKALAAVSSLALVSACGSSAEEANQSEEIEESRESAKPEGFTDFSGMVVASMAEGAKVEDGWVNSIMISIYDPGEDEQLTQLAAGEIIRRNARWSDGLLVFSSDFSHLAYKEDASPESDLLVYRLKGEADEAKLIHRIEPPSDIEGVRINSGFDFQPDGERLWYSLAGDDGDPEVHSIGLDEGEEPRSEGSPESRNWEPGPDGRIAYFDSFTKETSVEGGSAEVKFYRNDEGFRPLIINFTSTETGQSPQIFYDVFHSSGEGREVLAGGVEMNSPASEPEHEWGPLMRLTFDEEGTIEESELLIPETERRGVNGLQVSPDGGSAVIAVTDRRGVVSNNSAEFYYVDLDSPTDTQQLDHVVPEEVLQNDKHAWVRFMGWME